MCGAVQLNESARDTCDHVDMPVVAVLLANNQFEVTCFVVHDRALGNAMADVRVMGRRRLAVAPP
ncbi:hypothetical protein D3C76_1222880 [compost metagenome]